VILVFRLAQKNPQDAIGLALPTSPETGGPLDDLRADVQQMTLLGLWTGVRRRRGMVLSGYGFSAVQEPFRDEIFLTARLEYVDRR